jgi:hypothetical protein
MRDFARHTPYAIAVLVIAGLCNYSMHAGLPDKNGKQQFDIQTLLEIDEQPTPPKPAVNTPAELPVIETLPANPLESFRPTESPQQPDELADKLERSILIVANLAGITKENPKGNFPQLQSAKYKSGSGSTGGGGSTGSTISASGSGGSTGNVTSSVYYTTTPTYSYQQPTNYSNCPNGVCTVPATPTARPRVFRR